MFPVANVNKNQDYDITTLCIYISLALIRLYVLGRTTRNSLDKENAVLWWALSMGLAQHIPYTNILFLQKQHALVSKVGLPAKPVCDERHLPNETCPDTCAVMTSAGAQWRGASYAIFDAEVCFGFLFNGNLTLSA